MWEVLKIHKTRKPTSHRVVQNSLTQKHHITILADSHGRQMSSILSERLPSSFSVTGVFKPNAKFAGVIDELDTLSQGHTKRDTIIIMGGQNDINLGGSFNPIGHIQKLKRASQYTNIVLISLPPRHM